MENDEEREVKPEDVSDSTLDVNDTPVVEDGKTSKKDKDSSVSLTT